MKPSDFVACVAKEKQELLAAYFAGGSDAAVAQKIKALHLTPEQTKALREIVDGALTDAFYTFLLALEGATALGGKQRSFELRDEDGTLLSGELEGPAWERFHGGDAK